MANTHTTILRVHFKLNSGTDGVTLQAKELNRGLGEYGFSVLECACDVPDDELGLKLPELSYQSDEVSLLRKKIFYPPTKEIDFGVFGEVTKEKEEAILHEIDLTSHYIKDKVKNYIANHSEISIVHVHNLFSLPLHPAATYAFYQLVKELPDLLFISQDHDMVYEGRQHMYRTPYKKVQKLLDTILLPDLPNVRHAVLSTRASEIIFKEKGIHAAVIPDMFDFDQATRVHQNIDFKNLTEKYNIADGDLIVGIMARIIRRKGIEFAIQYVAELQRNRKKFEDIEGGIGIHKKHFTNANKIVLLLVQKEDCEEQYFLELKRFAQDLNVLLTYIGDDVVADSVYDSQSDKYPFYSVYNLLDIVCYPSISEGFGNQLLEQLAIARDQVPDLFEYPVFVSDIAPYVRHVVSLGDHYESMPGSPTLRVLDAESIAKAAQSRIALLLTPEHECQLAKENYEAAKATFGMRPVIALWIQLYAHDKKV